MFPNTASKDSAVTHVAAPTATIIAADANDPYYVWVLRPTAKHNGKLVLPGGKIELHAKQSPRQCAIDEFNQEAGGQGAYLKDLKLFALRFDPYGDVREVSLAKVTNESGPPEDKNKPVIAYYGTADSIFLAEVIGVPAPKDGEAKEFLRIDVREIESSATPEESRFGAQHDLVLLLYRLYLDGRPVQLEDLEDLAALRAKLPTLLKEPRL
ncbi:MAG: NUDIX hydrolase [Candidatus Melainabacteria bacterium]|nr:NUDIX hydrolase [Candidatus Melainabacteria bacterium]